MGEGAMTRERILAEALDLFARHGYAGARMEKIAAGVGINKASLYFHFKSKEEIFMELFRTIVESYFSFLKRIIGESSELPTRERLEYIYRAYLSDSWDNREQDFWNRIYYFPPESMKDDIYRVTQEEKDRFQENLSSIFMQAAERGEIRAEEPKALAKTFYYLVTCISLSVGILSREEGLRDMDECFETFWNGYANTSNFKRKQPDDR